MLPANRCSAPKLRRRPGQPRVDACRLGVIGWALQHLSPLFELRLQSFLSPGSSSQQAPSVSSGRTWASPGVWEEDASFQVEQHQQLPDVGAAETPEGPCPQQGEYVHSFAVVLC